MNDKTTESDLRKAFTNAVEGQVGTGIYVWGGNGELLDEMTDPKGWIERRETSKVNAERATRLLASRKQQGIRMIRAFDCSGLVYWALKGLGVLKSDVSSRGLYAMCRPIEESELKSGDLVFHHDGKQIVHVGVWIGPEQVECKGRDEGVVKNIRKRGYWNRFGRLDALPLDTAEAHVVVKGGSVYLREGGGIGSKAIGIAHRGDCLPLRGTAPSGWYRVAWGEKEAYITNKPQYTEVRHG